jgi:hypothetical protein
MRYSLYIISLAIVFIAFPIRSGYAQYFLDEKVYIVEEKKDPRVNKIEEKIKTHNLLNLLDLSKEQLIFLIGKAKEIEKISGELYSSYSRNSEEMLRFEIEIEKEVGTGRTSLDKPVLDGFSKSKVQTHQVYYKLNDVVEAGVKAVEGQLKDFQLVILDNYVPCIIPTINNSLMGASDRCIGLGYILLGIKGLPEEKYQKEKHGYIAKSIAMIKANFCPCKRLCEDSVAQKEMLKAMDEVRKLDDVDFTLNMERLAKGLEEKIVLKDHEPDRARKIQRLLLSSQSIPILEKRLSSKK